MVVSASSTSVLKLSFTELSLATSGWTVAGDLDGAVVVLDVDVCSRRGVAVPNYATAPSASTVMSLNSTVPSLTDSLRVESI
jgi:hypothetical protein